MLLLLEVITKYNMGVTLFIYTVTKLILILIDLSIPTRNCSSQVKNNSVRIKESKSDLLKYPKLRIIIKQELTRSSFNE
jgi:hypothetical protein